MSVVLAPYTNAMRLGQGFNSYTQQICVDDAVVIDPTRTENVITNDGTTMRIVSQAAGKPSAWNRITEVVREGPVATQALLKSSEAGPPAVAPNENPASGNSEFGAKHVDPPVVGRTQSAPKAQVESVPSVTLSRSVAESATASAKASEASRPTERVLQSGNATSSKTFEEPARGNDVEVKEANTGLLTAMNIDKGDIGPDSAAAGSRKGDIAREPVKSSSTEITTAPEGGALTSGIVPSATSMSGNDNVPNMATPTNAIGLTMQHVDTSLYKDEEAASQQATSTSPVPDKLQVNQASSGTTEEPAAPVLKTPSELEIEQARLDKEEKMVLMREEKERMAEQRKHTRQLELQDREQEQAKALERQKVQAEIAQEKREYDRARRLAAQQAIKDAVASKGNALTMEDLNKIKAQNQFADHFDGIVKGDEIYTFNSSGSRGPSQTVAYSSRFIDKLSDVTEDMAISGALSIKMAKVGGSGRGSFVNSDKFKNADLNFYISVKVTNQTVNFKDALVYNPLRSVPVGSDDFNKVYGDTFISGFQEGGEFNAVISMSVHNKAKLLDIQAEAKVALTAGPVDITAEANVGIARTNLEMNTETTIQVSWCGGGHIKPMEQPWNIQSVMQAAARFPSLVAECPQRTYAILARYDSLRSFLSLRPAGYSPLQYENAQTYTGILMDAFMSYKSLYKKLGDQTSNIQSKILEFEPLPDAESQTIVQQPLAHPESDQAKAAMSQAVASGSQAAVVLLKQQAEAALAKADRTPFVASLSGLADARKYIRRQMIYIVNEVDLIEKDPKVATDRDHDEPYQDPSLFETRLPATRIPELLRPKSDPLTGKRIMAKTQTTEELLKEQSAQAKIDEKSPKLYRDEYSLSSEETSSLESARMKTPMIGQHMQVSRAAPENFKGDLFNNLDYLFPEWQVESVTIGITSHGCVGFVKVEYENGLTLRKGLPKADLGEGGVERFLGNFQAQERITSASIEFGTVCPDTASQTSNTMSGKAIPADPQTSSKDVNDATAIKDTRVLSVCMYTNRGQRLLGQASRNEIMTGGRIKKNDTVYENVETLYLDSAFSTGTFKGFFGRLSLDKLTGGILRLGLIWGDTASNKLHTTEKSAAPIYETDPSSFETSMNAMRAELNQAKNEVTAVRKQAQADLTKSQAVMKAQAEADIATKVAEAVRNSRQIKAGNGVSTGRVSASFTGNTFRVHPSMEPFLQFENGNRIIYQPNGSLVVYASNGTILWQWKADGYGFADLIFHGNDNEDGNLVAWGRQQGQKLWETGTMDCKRGRLVFSSEKPYVEIFTESGVRRWARPEW